MRRIINHCMEGMKFFTAILILPIYKIFNREKIYLIGERKDQCQDNGYHLFKYIRENHNEKKIFYCITKDSSQLNKINYLGNIVYYKSLKHYLYYLLAEKLICAHVGSCTPDTPFTWKFEGKGIIKKRKIFIQHGISIGLIQSLMYDNTKFETFVCGAKPEYEYIKKNFKYPDESVKYLGLCRFDNLHEFNLKNQILVMPTWRQWFGMNGNNEISIKKFKNSNYFKAYNSFINNKNLNDILEKFDVSIIFYAHHEMQRYLEIFNTNSKKIIIANEDEYDVQTLLKESKLLITDYSSVSFDFAYMKKPIIYYQFDDKKYYKSHYKKGYFDYERDGFGEVTKDEGELIRCIDDILKNKENKYVDRIDKFFVLNDSNNCKRHYEYIMNT
ncbi:CDP-glycerol glycerophosphotransferase family protein [Clostridium sardiniense]|uniref:CDP-glycerol glycerophosphotransferase family protein n=1 Tax=Clostridium sardiniense TaxID=29369 RepID=UPI003D33334D